MSEQPDKAAAQALLQRITAYLRERHTASIATVGQAGAPDAGVPHAATVFYALDSHLRLIFLSKSTSAHALHIKEGSRVAVTVAGEYRDWHEIQGVQLWGTGEVLHGASRAAAAGVYLARFPFVRSMMKDRRLLKRIGEVQLFRVTPERAAFTDNQAGPFGREVLRLGPRGGHSEALAGHGPAALGAAGGRRDRSASEPGVSATTALGPEVPGAPEAAGPDSHLRGVVITGRMEAGGFLEVPWVKERIAGLLGAEPFPGTLNLRLVEEADRGLWRERVSSGACLAVIPPEEGFCPASYFPVEVDGLIPGGIILPHVEGYPEDVIELVAGGRLRDLLALADGDEVTVTLLPAEA
jgi:uncharacterized protein YhbP (UPF0306 family)